MDPSASQSSSAGPSKGLSRERIVGAAIESIDRDGAQGLTMRNLGQDLGVEAMSLYRYVSGREDLLEGVVAHLLEGLRQAMETQPAENWQTYLQVMAHGVRAVATEHPAAFPLIATRHPATPWLRPPLRSPELLESFLEKMSSFGFGDPEIVAIYRAFTSFLLGHLLLEASAQGAETSPVEVPLDEGEAEVPNHDGDTDFSDKPFIQRLRPLLSEDHSQAEFEIALETLLDRLELDFAQ